jgi:trehalose/maltose transport system substrate-binding protein
VAGRARRRQRRRRRGPLTQALALGLALLLAAGCRGDDGAGVVSVACGSVGVEYDVCREGALAWSRATGHPVRVVATPNESTAILALYRQLLSARSPDLDVLRIDVVWTGLLAPSLLDLSPFVPRDAVAAHFPALVENNTVGGALVALPLFVDVGLLYYRTDLLAAYGREVPATWAALTETARLVQEGERRAGRAMWGYVFQGRAYEGLTCNALEWIASAGGGRLLERGPIVTVDNPAAEAALRRAASWIGTIAPRGVLNYAEEEARGVFQSGRAVFMRNWPYAFALANAADSPVRGKVGVAPLPAGGGRSAATLGGYQLAVSRFSRRPREAVDLARHLTGAAEQRRAALAGGLNPTLRALYDDPALRAANPYLDVLRTSLETAVARPAQASGRRYPQVSSEVWNAVHDALAGRRSAAASLADLRERLGRLAGRPGW